MDEPRTRGVTRAQHRAITADTCIDNGEWLGCALSDVTTTDTGRQWRREWDAPSGEHALTVRATDGEGNVQTSAVAGVVPDRAAGLHSVTVTVE
ncbi:hypothetical protein [Glycomyces paridis]|uniref:Bacterial Ig-like domain-containing protein n=1 Tax=Glycomyces paridis TaxID=2126555 RepID=A0A4S8P7G2_9ACTN|nr:hypothetical protein [Glycomyces paridis]THV26198.1 hypothetical protein E9998_19030 [Glycomyces paridis]